MDIADITTLKEAGNLLFRDAHFDEALAKYRMALIALDSCSSIDNGCGKTLRVACLSNAAACALKLSQFQAALEYCDKVVALSSDNAKAKYRRALALKGLGQNLEALEELIQAKRLAPTDQLVLQEIDATFALIGNRDRDDDPPVLEDMSGMFSLPPPQPRAVKVNPPKAATGAVSLATTAPPAPKDLPTISKNPAAAKASLRLPEVQQAVRNPMMEVLEDTHAWCTPSLIQMIAARPHLAAAIQDERFSQALGELQANPREALAKYRGTPLDSVLKEFCEVLGDHFSALGAQDTKEPNQ
eukprot:gnl/Spiro4/26217_TR13069_c0_g1_i1.p2 gnl/Spiro4/26217_TR13069_c0_g1~~gnl/Spiro4/26217_TR13069_c0_g1_i1.p2  ORF type:complete len:300 (-),score=76.42 gnl/Spiro4/26217_TR13069_c0_g1_i1:159-1058(-)